MFDAQTDRADDRAFAARCENDRHHFRFIVSPEDAGEMTDLKAFTRDLARQMEADLGTKLDWMAVDHWNTDNPHVHLLVRGVDETGADLVISRGYVSRGLRSRVVAYATIMASLGQGPVHGLDNVATHPEVATSAQPRAQPSTGQGRLRRRAPYVPVFASGRPSGGATPGRRGRPVRDGDRPRVTTSPSTASCFQPCAVSSSTRRPHNLRPKQD